MVKATDLIKQQKDRQKLKEKTFKKIYKIAEKKMIIANTGDNSCIWFEIPEFLLGVPIYKIKECKKYLEKKLKKNGFKTNFFEPNFLKVDWSSEE
tara:strand:- start:1044 stop:1328 length:285 start_codon:yes stop_codon:yes gene_type:complete